MVLCSRKTIGSASYEACRLHARFQRVTYNTRKGTGEREKNKQKNPLGLAFVLTVIDLLLVVGER